MAILGLDRLNRKFRAMPMVVQRLVVPAMEEGAKEIVALMKRLAPFKDGNLVRSIGWTWGPPPKGAFALMRSKPTGKERLRITIYAGNANTMVTNERGVEFQNAFLQEFGTKDMPANPYFYPSWRALRRRARGKISRAIRKGVKAGAK